MMCRNFICLLLLKYALFTSAFESRENLGFTLTAIYNNNESKLTSIGVRGNGLGLTWDRSKGLVATENEGIWTFDVNYKTDYKGSYCQDCGLDDEGFVAKGNPFSFKFFAKTGDSSDEVEMIGSAFTISLPISKVSTAFKVKPNFEFYPYFYTNSGEHTSLVVGSDLPEVGSRKMIVYMPPGLKENPRPVYDVYYIIDMDSSFVDTYKKDLDMLFNEGIAQEAIIIGHGDWQPDPVYQDIWIERSHQLTQVPGENLICAQGSWDDGCNYCLPNNITNDDEYYYWMTAGGCGYSAVYGGNADNNVEFLLTSVFDTVEEYLNVYFNTKLTREREGTNIIGFSDGGLFSCYAAWTRPKTFGGASCHSPSFWWPFKTFPETAIAQFDFLNSTLRTNLEDRLPQKFVIDVGELEGDSSYKMLSGTTKGFELISEHPMFAANKNVWLQIFPGHSHTNKNWMKRIWNAFQILSTERN